MIRIILFFAFVLAGISLSAQQTFTITASGFQFSPAIVNAKVGDIISFTVGTSHPILQVDESTFTSNGNTALQGGFSFPTGSGNFTAVVPGTIYYICANHFSSGMKGKIEISQVISILTPSLTSFDIFPNPADEILFVINPGNSKPISVSIFNMAGKMLLKSDNLIFENNKISIILNDLRKGLYFITVTYPEKTYTRKFIKL